MNLFESSTFLHTLSLKFLKQNYDNSLFLDIDDDDVESSANPAFEELNAVSLPIARTLKRSRIDKQNEKGENPLQQAVIDADVNRINTCLKMVK